MMLYPAMNKLKSHIPNRYMLVNVVALRARQIADDAEEAGVQLDEKPVTLAIHEVADGKIDASGMDLCKNSLAHLFVLLSLSGKKKMHFAVLQSARNLHSLIFRSLRRNWHLAEKQVAGLHRAVPSVTLDKAIQLHSYYKGFFQNVNRKASVFRAFCPYFSSWNGTCTLFILCL